MGDTLSLTITRRGKEAGVEKRFVTGLVRRGIVPAVVKDETDRKSTRLNSSHLEQSRMPSSA